MLQPLRCENFVAAKPNDMKIVETVALWCHAILLRHLLHIPVNRDKDCVIRERGSAHHFVNCLLWKNVAMVDHHVPISSKNLAHGIRNAGVKKDSELAICGVQAAAS